MSTPTTATAILPPYHHGGYPFSHQPYAGRTSPYRPSNLSTAARLPPAFPYPGSPVSSPAHALPANGLTLSSASSSRQAYPESAVSSRPEEANYTTMPAHPSAHQDSLPASKRRRSDGPDWQEFYKNGLPKEVIVIDDSPEPATTPASTKTLTNGHTNGVAPGAPTPATTAGGRHVAKKRKRDDEAPATRYDPVHNRVLSSNTNERPSGSTISSDRTNSVIQTTAATSLGSHSSNGNGHYDYEAQPGQKRKRTTRQQIANEAKKREVDLLSHPHVSYQPPPNPPKKASEVPVRLCPDVSRSPSHGRQAGTLTRFPAERLRQVRQGGRRGRPLHRGPRRRAHRQMYVRRRPVSEWPS